ncbi:hypothetical protein [Rhodoferax saidenbachensis]|uniref:DUF4410 domain-containing protein n=1 Tax=Rhodoferax saidenbachensis TaxID=1484693 RepID=A0A1P8KAU7_9BURK|nr:hypothetical protein [Rhodoferax saidenbachensis]APW43110.1 hypothetical protein RS694_11615 [Rhodoferax saidenbachensis]
MKSFARFFSVAVGVVTLLAVQGCATSIKASSTQNPPPKEAFSAFGKIELKTVVFKAGTKGDASGLAKIDENLKKNLARSLDEWNARPANGRTLTIEPVIEEMAFQHGAKRVLLGPLAGSSGVLLRLNIRDAAGREVAAPEFFQRADAWSAGFVVGVHDNLMLTRVAQLASNYVIGNYARAQGGPTGADEKAVAPN